MMDTVDGEYQNYKAKDGAYVLKDFHASHYHPSQAVFMTAGDISAAEVQEQIEQKVLSKLAANPQPRMLPELAQAWTAPRSNEVRIPSQQAKDDEYGVQLTWMMGESSDIDVFFNTYLLWEEVQDDAAACVQLEEAGFVDAPKALKQLAALRFCVAQHVACELLQLVLGVTEMGI